MIIARTPLRISFFGGGTDHPTWYKAGNNGAVLSTSIDKYVYTILRPLPPIFDFNYRIAWRILEQVKTVDEIQHPVVREVLKNYSPGDGVGYELAYNADLPARSGLGSSSSFSVSALHALFHHLGRETSKAILTREAIRVEQDFLKELVGSQDQTAAAYGGLNRIDFKGNGDIVVDPVDISPKRKAAFASHLMMFFTGFTRDAGAVEKKKVGNFEANRKQLERMYQMVGEGTEILEDRNVPLAEFGKLLDDAWLAKRTLSDGVSNGPIDTIYAAAINAGALGGKLLGAGGGGFLLFFVQPEKHGSVRAALKQCKGEGGRSPVEVPIAPEDGGSQIIFQHG